MKIDRILTSRLTGIPIMLALLAVVFYITIAGANLPSQLLSEGFLWIQEQLTAWFAAINAPPGSMASWCWAFTGRLPGSSP